MARGGVEQAAADRHQRAQRSLVDEGEHEVADLLSDGQLEVRRHDDAPFRHRRGARRDHGDGGVDGHHVDVSVREQGGHRGSFELVGGLDEEGGAGGCHDIGVTLAAGIKVEDVPGSIAERLGRLGEAELGSRHERGHVAEHHRGRVPDHGPQPRPAMRTEIQLGHGQRLGVEPGVAVHACDLRPPLRVAEQDDQGADQVHARQRGTACQPTVPGTRSRTATGSDWKNGKASGPTTTSKKELPRSLAVIPNVASSATDALRRRPARVVPDEAARVALALHHAGQHAACGGRRSRAARRRSAGRA